LLVGRPGWNRLVFQGYEIIADLFSPRQFRRGDGILMGPKTDGPVRSSHSVPEASPAHGPGRRQPINGESGLLMPQGQAGAQALFPWDDSLRFLPGLMAPPAPRGRGVQAQQNGHP
jgi:hypothetical protein